MPVLPSMPPIRRWIHLIALLSLLPISQAGAGEGYGFGVLSQRSPTLTAQYWNPILDYVSRKAGVVLQLKIARTAPESNVAIAQGEYDFVYSNTTFTPNNAKAGYRVILRPRAASIRSQIVALAGSPIDSLEALRGQAVGFPSQAAFVGYAVPMDHLLRSGIRVEAVFGGNQEGIMGQLKAGKVAAAGVNDQVMAHFAAREGLPYRVLWESPPYHNLPISAHPRVPEGVVVAVQAAFDGMGQEPEGAKVLAESAQVIKEKPPFGFMRSTPDDYRNYTDFYRDTLVTDIQ